MFQRALLKEKRVVLTGGAGRFGRILAERFTDAGASVSSVVRNGRIPDDAPAQDRPRFFEADLCDEVQVQDAFTKISSEVGVPDILVHAAGGWAETPLLETPLEEWNGLISRNLTSTFLCFREAARLMRGGHGRLIAITSAQGADQGQPRQSAYSAAKAGVVRLVESADAELKASGIRTFALAPSYIVYGDDPTPGVTASDLAELCLYLSSGAADSLSGSVIRAYGGRR